MRDVRLMAQMLRLMRDEANGTAQRVRSGSRGFLIAGGWVRHLPGTEQGRIVAWPTFATASDQERADG